MLPRSAFSCVRAVNCAPIRMPGIEPTRIQPTYP